MGCPQRAEQCSAGLARPAACGQGTPALTHLPHHVSAHAGPGPQEPPPKPWESPTRAGWPREGSVYLSGGAVRDPQAWPVPEGQRLSCGEGLQETTLTATSRRPAPVGTASSARWARPATPRRHVADRVPAVPLPAGAGTPEPRSRASVPGVQGGAARPPFSSPRVRRPRGRGPKLHSAGAEEVRRPTGST